MGLSAVAAFIVAAVVLDALARQAPPWVSQVRPGLTPAEVGRIIRADRPEAAAEGWVTNGMLADASGQQTWDKDGWRLAVIYRRGKVDAVAITARPYESPLAALWRWLGR